MKSRAGDRLGIATGAGGSSPFVFDHGRDVVPRSGPGVAEVRPIRAKDRRDRIRADVSKGGVRLTLVCAKQADKLATEFMAGRITSNVPVLATIDVRTTARLEIKPTSCPVIMIATPLDNEPTRFAWERPTSEIARSTGGPMIHCQARPKL